MTQEFKWNQEHHAGVLDFAITRPQFVLEDSYCIFVQYSFSCALAVKKDRWSFIINSEFRPNCVHVLTK